MAALHYSPRPEVPEDLGDPVTYKVAVDLLARTGHSVGVETIRRYVREDSLATVLGRGRTAPRTYVSWTDVLNAHYKRTAAKLRAGSTWP